MKGGILLVCLALAASAGAAEKKPAERKAKAPEKTQTAPQIAPEVLSDVWKSKQRLRAAVGACARPGSCDPASRNANRELVELLTGAQEQFMTACTACASQEKCDAERQRMLDGKRSPGAAPCQ